MIVKALLSFLRIFGVEIIETTIENLTGFAKAHPRGEGGYVTNCCAHCLREAGATRVAPRRDEVDGGEQNWVQNEEGASQQASVSSMSSGRGRTRGEALSLRGHLPATGVGHRAQLPWAVAALGNRNTSRQSEAGVARVDNHCNIIGHQIHLTCDGPFDTCRTNHLCIALMYADYSASQCGKHRAADRPTGRSRC